MATADEAEPAGYPAEWEFDGLLRNGEAVVVRPIRPADAPALAGLRAATSPGTHQHVLLAGPALSLQAAARFSEVDYDARMAFVALVSDELVGLASYDRPGMRQAPAGFGEQQGHAPRGLRRRGHPRDSLESIAEDDAQGVDPARQRHDRGPPGCRRLTAVCRPSAGGDHEPLIQRGATAPIERRYTSRPSSRS